jgi:hypothetical protein
VKKLLKFDIFEKVQPEWIQANPKFYLSQAQKELKKKKEKGSEDKKEKDYIDNLKKIKVEDIKFNINDENKTFDILEPSFLKNKVYIRSYSDDSIGFSSNIKTEFNYKIILSLIRELNKNTILFSNIEKTLINPIFSNLNDFYGLYYSSMETNIYPTVYLFLTKNINKYKNKIKKIRSNNENKIIYYNNKVKGREFTDIENLEINKIRNKLKNITIDDIYFEKTEESKYGDQYSVKFKDKKLDSDVYKYNLISKNFFNQEKDPSKVYFGHLKNRYHTHSLSDAIKGIGLGYKIYKAFLKFNGYMVSDEQTSLDARKMYLYMLKDSDIYYIIDKNIKNKEKDAFSKDSAKVMLIWKDYPKIEQIVKIVRENELRNKRKYDYDKELQKYIK